MHSQESIAILVQLQVQSHRTFIPAFLRPCPCIMFLPEMIGAIERLENPPQAHMELCLAGNMKIPIYVGTHTHEDGSFKQYEFLELKQRDKDRRVIGNDPAQWLWPQIGYTGTEAHSPMPWSLLFFQECNEQINKMRGKRSRAVAGTWKGADGNIMASMVTLQIRGRKLIVENNVKFLRIYVGENHDEKVEIINWVIAQLWYDRRIQLMENQANGPATKVLKKPSGAHVSKELEKSPFTEKQKEIWKNMFKKILDHDATKSATFGWVDHKFRVIMHYRPKNPVYVSVPDWKSVIQYDDIMFESSVEQVVEQLIERLDTEWEFIGHELAEENHAEEKGEPAETHAEKEEEPAVEKPIVDG